MRQQSNLSVSTLSATSVGAISVGVIVVAVIVGSIASSLAVELAVVESIQADLSYEVSTAHFVFMTVSAPVAVAMARRNRPATALGLAHLALLAGGGLCVTSLSLTAGVAFLALGLQLMLAVLLMTAWQLRSRSVPALLLAGGFAVHYNIDRTLNRNGLIAEVVDRWGTATFAAASAALLLSGVLARWTSRGPTHGPPPAAIGSAGLQLDTRVLLMTAVAVALSMLVTIADVQGLWSQRFSFRRPDEWHRFLDLIVVLHTLPLVFMVIRRGRKWLAAGPFALSAGTTIALLSASPEGSMSLLQFASKEILLGWGTAILIGGAVALVMRSAGGREIDIAAIAFLAVLPLIERASVRASAAAINPSLIDLEGSTDVRPFLLAATVGFIGLGAWWFVRESGDRRSSPEAAAPVRETA